ncbi:S8 family serine peptidase [Brumimicrobium mesophilum]|uniref:S8 family serine peptidase n=1 Tax=Brumimicrobium mesophilum TaxID=392717 RepID=UPI000D140EF8|nr:S8 family serine peptidase [Brumimicrobium mesophilum]
MKYILFFILVLPCFINAQEKSWHHLDPIDDDVLGISTQKANEFLASKKADTVIVAIIDNGVELTHEDLQGTFWVNPYEIPGNGIDDDQNGYIDDIHGWNFIGNQNGENLKMETTGLTRMYALLSKEFEGKSEEEIDSEKMDDFRKFQTVKEVYEAEVESKKVDIAYYNKVLMILSLSEEVMTKYFNKSDYTENEVRKIKTKDQDVLDFKEFLIQVYDSNLDRKSIEKKIEDLNKELETRLNPNFKNRENIVGDNPDDLTDSIYGNNMVHVKGPYHGTGVASIVGALNNDFGIDGVAKHVKLMIIRIVPNGDERDKDIALAFRYAVKNGADIISCSFAKKYSMHPEFVEKAVDEAEKAGVLIVLAAGNNGNNNDETPYYPTGLNERGSKAKNFITVGASRENDDEDLAAFFSNYGKKTVDIFAPGYNIDNCVLSNGYGKGSGTSTAAPVVAGMAAVLKSYYPHLSAQELKEIIMKSAYIPKTKKVNLPNLSKKEFIDFKELSVAGGIANLYRAVMLVEKEYQDN